MRMGQREREREHLKHYVYQIIAKLMKDGTMREREHLKHYVYQIIAKLMRMEQREM